MAHSGLSENAMESVTLPPLAGNSGDANGSENDENALIPYIGCFYGKSQPGRIQAQPLSALRIDASTSSGEADASIFLSRPFPS